MFLGGYTGGEGGASNLAESKAESELRGGNTEESIGLGVKEGEASVRGGKEAGDPRDGVGYAGESMVLDGGSSGSEVVGMGVERSARSGNVYRGHQVAGGEVSSGRRERVKWGSSLVAGGGAKVASEVALQHKTARGATLARLRPRAELAHRSKRLGSLGPSRRVPTLGPTSAKKAQVLGRRRSKVDHFLFSSEQGAGLFSSRRSRPCFAAHSSRPAVLGLPTAGQTGARGW
ncbi:hypothetical protein Pmani_025663 [Petrolisthes manimaculis]|uniref:Uncharacterized protein n=1 Tax=Petrolisthes manimaculis TaxID=1843537 RepID=A0AAE1P5Q2_9EUCA|nr:hypothetical protein Pmani_029444 [Petrolisthes manimaculis]KAK4302233.1 hypothetical protein Pmani_025663 [Petrolisthes manimaculis]